MASHRQWLVLSFPSLLIDLLVPCVTQRPACLLPAAAKTAYTMSHSESSVRQCILVLDSSLIRPLHSRRSCASQRPTFCSWSLGHSEHPVDTETGPSPCRLLLHQRRNLQTYSHIYWRLLTLNRCHDPSFTPSTIITPYHSRCLHPNR
jgi:hypothetical protein